MYYSELALEFRDSLKFLTGPTDLFISVPSERAKTSVSQIFSDWPNGTVTIRTAPNRGRDIAPKLITFRDVYDAYELVLHLHTKKSVYNPRLVSWRHYLVKTLVGSPEIISTILNLFALQPKLGLVAPEHYEPIWPAVEWGSNFGIANDIASKWGIRLDRGTTLDFPSGSMFWARSEALRPLLDLDLSIDSFPEERGQVDGTLAHAIERLYFICCERAGFHWLKIARPELFSRNYAIFHAKSLYDVNCFMKKRTLRLVRD